jgi:hypothetical protein
MVATSVKDKVLLTMPDTVQAYRLERKHGNGGQWLVFTDQGFIAEGVDTEPVKVSGSFVDSPGEGGIYQYRARIFDDSAQPYDYSPWMRCGDTGTIGYTFGNYKAPEGQWGEILTPDDISRTYMWGVDFRASNGEAFTDEQIKFFIESAMKQIERELNITVKKTRVVCEPEGRGLQKGVDYDEEESYYTFKRERIQRNGMITTNKRPVQAISRLDIINRKTGIYSLLDAYTLDKTKGMIKYFNRPPRVSDSIRSVETAIFPYGAETYDRNLFYAIDYVAGFPSSDDVPVDLREVIGKIAAVSLLNAIGRGLMSGFSSSSLSMDGVSESFSSTQSATSAYYGADIKEYKDDIANYIAKNKMKFGHVPMGAL